MHIKCGGSSDVFQNERWRACHLFVRGWMATPHGMPFELSGHDGDLDPRALVSVHVPQLLLEYPGRITREDDSKNGREYAYYFKSVALLFVSLLFFVLGFNLVANSLNVDCYSGKQAVVGIVTAIFVILAGMFTFFFLLLEIPI